MRRAMYFTAVCLFACCIASMAKAEEEHHREGGGRSWFGTFEKTADGKVVLKSGNESHVVVAGDKAKDETKAKLTAADKELVGQGNFQVIGVMKKDGDSSIIVANVIVKKGDGDAKKEEHK